MPILPDDKSFKMTANQTGISQSVTQSGLDGTDRQQILRRPWISRPAWRELRQQPRREISETNCRILSNGRGDLHSNNSRELHQAVGASSKPEEPAVPVESTRIR